MKRYTLTGNHGVDLRASHELRTRVSRGRSLCWRQIQNRANGTERVSEGHVRSAVKDAAGGAEIVANVHFSQDSIGGKFEEPNAHQSGKQGLE
jgi:hypothetical protein